MSLACKLCYLWHCWAWTLNWSVLCLGLLVCVFACFGGGVLVGVFCA